MGTLRDDTVTVPATREGIMKIEVLGTGCAKCNKLEATAKAAVEKLGIPYEIHHIRDINEIVARGLMATPALAIDGKVVVAGRVPGEAELTTMITSALS
jgi:small redox-active disulfide protein 2